MATSPYTVQLKISLVGLKPEIWRRVLAPSDLCLADLHYLIQGAMGWKQAHLHEFTVGPQRYGPHDGHLEPTSGTLDEEQVTLAEVLPKKGSKLSYLYDFGDSWKHLVAVEKVIEQDLPTPVLVDGERACPPEDCGGVPGYGRIVQAFASGKGGKPRGLDQDELAWLGSGFHPENFDLEQRSKALEGMLEAGEDSEFDGEDPEAEFEWMAFDADDLPLVYDPNDLRGPDPKRWMAASEDARVASIAHFHELTGAEYGENFELHAAIHGAIESQLAAGSPPELTGALDRLIKGGVNRHDAVHAVGAALATHLFDTARAEGDAPELDDYVDALDALGQQPDNKRSSGSHGARGRRGDRTKRRK
jgi:hypothetical protein